MGAGGFIDPCCPAQVKAARRDTLNADRTTLASECCRPLLPFHTASIQSGRSDPERLGRPLRRNNRKAPRQSTVVRGDRNRAVDRPIAARSEALAVVLCFASSRNGLAFADQIMNDDVVDLLTLEDVLSLFPGVKRPDVERLWTMMRDGIKGAGWGNDVEKITAMLASTPPSDGEGMRDGQELNGQTILQRFDEVRRLIEKRRRQRASPH
jgi:hypothetical protein